MNILLAFAILVALTAGCFAPPSPSQSTAPPGPCGPPMEGINGQVIFAPSNETTSRVSEILVRLEREGFKVIEEHAGSNGCFHFDIWHDGNHSVSGRTNAMTSRVKECRGLASWHGFLELGHVKKEETIEAKLVLEFHPCIKQSIGS